MIFYAAKGEGARRTYHTCMFEWNISSWPLIQTTTMVEHYPLNLELQVTLTADIEVFKLQGGNTFQHRETKTDVLYVRECTRIIYTALNNLRKKSKESAEEASKAALIGQTGIGKSFSLYYFAYRFLQEDDVDVVVLQSYETKRFQVFHKVKVPENLSGVFHIDVQTEGEVKRLLDNKQHKAVLLVDLVVAIIPDIIRLPGEGFTVYSSSPAPYTAHLKQGEHKHDLKKFTPPPLTMDETSAIYDHFDNCLCKQKYNLSFEEYFDLFGGTLRPMKKADYELEKMLDGANKVQDEDPHKILEIVLKGPVQAVEDSTHALFAEGGGLKARSFETSFSGMYDGERRYRSAFTRFWFTKYIAPRILFKHYNMKVLNVLYNADEKAGGGRGLDFEDIFHHILPLGDWTLKQVPEERSKANLMEMGAALILLLPGVIFSNKGGGTGEKEKLKLSGVPVVQRGKDENDEYDLSPTGWLSKQKKKRQEKQKKIEKKRMAEPTEEEQIASTKHDRRDVAHLIKTWKAHDRFYWIPLGKEFPGIDAVFKDSDSVYFIQVKTGKTADEMTGWVAEALEIVHLLLDILKNETTVTVKTSSLLLGAEPGTTPMVGARKRRKLWIPNGGMHYVVAPQPENAPEDLKLDWDVYKSLKHKFSNFKASEERLARLEKLKNEEGADTDCSTDGDRS